ncbi:MAG TPA: MmoB/DmpM family protein [Polyangiales bacterium]|jgi:hypothetical protein|nr:MmoB/DmpM family protein [Polyangiales bacterium]
MVEPLTIRVGPVLICGESADAVLAAIRAENSHVQAHDSDGYLRVSVTERCHVTRARIERELGRRFELPRDLEAIMPAFKGKLRLDSDSVSWER